MESWPAFLILDSKILGKSSDWPNWCQVLIFGIMVVAKGLGYIIGSVWFRISSSHNNSSQIGGM